MQLQTTDFYKSKTLMSESRTIHESEDSESDLSPLLEEQYKTSSNSNGENLKNLLGLNSINEFQNEVNFF